VIGQLKDDARQMRSDIKLKESALLDTTRELEQLKKRNMVLGTSLSSHRQEIRDLRGEKAVLESLSMRNASQEAGEILSYGGTQSRKTGPAVVSKYLDKSKLKIRELKRENNFLMAALERCDRAMASLKEAIAVIVAQKETTGKSGRGREGELPEDSMREKLKHVLDSLMRVKDQQVSLSWVQLFRLQEGRPLKSGRFSYRCMNAERN
jgi:chromosome segregation ATPase